MPLAADPSLTVTVIVVVPVCPAAGVSVTVRLAPLPPKTMFAFGTSAGLVELPLTVRFPPRSGIAHREIDRPHGHPTVVT